MTSWHSGLFAPLLLFFSFLSVVVVSAVSAQDEKKLAATRDFNATAALQNLEEFERATANWIKFITDYPQDERLDRAHFYLGYCHLRNKKYDEAAVAFQTVLAKFTKYNKLDAAQYYLGLALYEKAKVSRDPLQFKAAAAALGDVAVKFPQSSQAHKSLYYQGDALYSAADPQAALVPFQTLIAKFPDGPLLAQAYYDLGVTQQELKQYAEAAKTFQAFLVDPKLAQDSRVAEVHLRLGLAFFSQQQYAEAEKEFATAAAAPTFAAADLAMFRQAQCQIETAKLPAAIALLNGLILKFPESQYKAAAHLAAGKSYYLTDDFANAQKMLQPVADGKTDEMAEAAYWLGRTLLKMLKPQEAVLLMDRSIAAAAPQGEFVPYLLMTRINAIYDLPERRKETPPLYADFFAKYPEHPLTAQAIYMAALAALGEKDYVTASAHADQFLKQPKFAEHELMPGALFVAGESSLLPLGTDLKGGDAAKAEPYFRQLVTKYPEHERAGRAHLRIGWCLNWNKQFDAAVQYLTSVLAKLKEPALVAEAQLLIGRAHTGADRAQESVVAFEAALTAKPDWERADEVLLELSQSQRAAANLQPAVERLRQLATTYQNSSYRDQALFLLGEILRQQEKLDEAIAPYSELPQKYPQSPLVASARYGLATVYFNKPDDTNALAVLGQLLTGGGDPLVVNSGRYLRGLVYQRQKKFAEAQADLQAFLNEKPKPDEALDARYGLVICQIGLKQFDPAKVALDVLLKEKPDHPRAGAVCYELGHALLENKLPEKAAVAFETLVKTCPNSPLVPESWFRVGNYHESLVATAANEELKAKSLADAAAAYAAGAAKAEEPRMREKLHYKLGDVQFQQANYAEAAKTLLAQVTQLPTGELAGAARFLAAESLFRQDQFAPALPLYLQVATEKVPQYHADALYRAGTCAASLKQWAESQTYYQDLIAGFKEFAQLYDARYGLGWALQNQNKLDEAIAVYEQLTKDTETEPAAKARFMIGEIAFAQQKYQEAIEHFLKASLGYPYKEWQVMAQFETGRCLVEQGKKEQAVKTFTQIVEKYADHPKAQDAQRLIGELNKK